MPSLTPDMLPGSFRAWLVDIADRTQAPIDFCAVGVIVALSILIGRGFVVRPKMRDDWEVAPNLWGAAIGRTGVMKSPALKAALAPLNRLVAEAFAEYRDAAGGVAADSAMRDAKAQLLKDNLKKVLKEQAKRAPASRGHLRSVPTDGESSGEPAAAGDGDEPESIAEELAKVRAGSAMPIQRRYMTNDPTVEKLGELLNENPRGLLVFRDELTGWLRTLDREGRENDRAFYLEAWEGRGAPYVYDRIARGTIRIEAPCVGVLGGIQPGPLADYIRAAVKGGVGDDGLMQRFQLAVYPDVSRDWKNVDRWPDTDAKNKAFAVFQRAAEPGFPVAMGAIHYPDEPESLPFLRLSPSAQVLFDDWRAPFERRLRSGEEHPAIEGHLSKYRKLVPALALIFYAVEVVDGAETGAVSDKAMALALRWATYLEAHARRIYASVTRSGVIAAGLLAAKLRDGKVPLKDGAFVARDVYRAGWTGLNDADVVAEALEELVALNWLRAEPVPPNPLSGGRPTVRYRPNPKVRRHA